jgi:hypothetical protein
MARLVATVVASVGLLVSGLLAQEFKAIQPAEDVLRLERLDVPRRELGLQLGEPVQILLDQLGEPVQLQRRVTLRGAVAQPQAIDDHPDLPADAKEMLTGFKTDVDAIQKKADEEIRQRRLRVIDELQKAQDRYTREAKLDEAVAIRDTIRRLKSAHLNLLPYPGNLFQFRELEGQPLHFQVTGRIGGSIWGTDVYTGDSDLATAAVHAGALNVGQTAIVEVRIVPSPPQHLGSNRNGVTTSSWGAYGFSYTVRKWTGDDKRPMLYDAIQPAKRPAGGF